ncbi:MAG: DUF4269 domain-containing protein [Bacteroidetes bacterium]|nr:DUF4269 domain-containing protein [Bacteroidota bacterium]
MLDFSAISYLKKGNPRQQEVFKILNDLLIFDKLKRFTPVLTGTIPIEIDIESSDLDIICYCKNLEEFKNKVSNHFKYHDDFLIDEKEIRNLKTVIARFKYQGYQIEIFGQNRPVNEQEAYRHMLIEWKILQKKGDLFKQQIIELKKQGYKTEPAFAKLLGFHGDPYTELLKLG